MQSGRAQEPTFEVKLSTPTAVFTVGSAVRVDITINNLTNDLMIFADPRCRPQAANVTVRDEHGAILEPRNEWSERTLTTAARPCAGGQAVPPFRSNTLFLNIARWFDLSTPGRYFIQAEPAWRDDKNTRHAQKSNVLEIEIGMRSRLQQRPFR